MSTKPKAEIMRELRTRRREAGLVKVECYILPSEKQRLAKYVVKTLNGECNVKIIDENTLR